MIIDSHCQLNYKDNGINIHSIIERAKKSGVDALLNISTKRSDFNKLIKTSSKFKNVYYSLGIHPHESSETNESTMNEVIKYSNDNKFIAIGETGLDFFYNHSDKDTQIKSLEMHIELAQEINLPLIIHMRDAEKELIDIFTNKIKIVVGDEWFAGNLSYHLNSRPIWVNDLKEKAAEIKDHQGVIYTGNPKVLKKLCPGVFGSIKPVGYCMIGKR